MVLRERDEVKFVPHYVYPMFSNDFFLLVRPGQHIIIITIIIIRSLLYNTLYFEQIRPGSLIDTYH
jgi:hypothetical protein